MREEIFQRQRIRRSGRVIAWADVYFVFTIGASTCACTRSTSNARVTVRVCVTSYHFAETREGLLSGQGRPFTEGGGWLIDRTSRQFSTRTAQPQRSFYPDQPNQLVLFTLGRKIRIRRRDLENRVQSQSEQKGDRNLRSIFIYIYIKFDNN